MFDALVSVAQRNCTRINSIKQCVIRNNLKWFTIDWGQLSPKI